MPSVTVGPCFTRVHVARGEAHEVRALEVALGCRAPSPCGSCLCCDRRGTPRAPLFAPLRTNLHHWPCEQDGL